MGFLDEAITSREPDTKVTIRTGVMTSDIDGNLLVNIGKGPIRPSSIIGRWSLNDGDPVRVLQVGEQLDILGPVGPVRPARGKVIAYTSGSPTVTLSTDAGPITCERLASYTPVVGQVCALLWQQSVPVAAGAIATATPTPGDGSYNPPAPPPPGQNHGTDRFTAIDSRSWTSTGRWNNTQKSNVMQGTYGGMTCQGLWCYGAAPSALAGRSISAIRALIGPRLRVGSYNQALTFNVILHPHRDGPPGGQITILDTFPVGGVPVGGQPKVNLPLSWASTIINGGGIGLAGGSYGGAAGIRDGAPDSGQLEIDWSM